jgi:hypothetical protein
MLRAPNEHGVYRLNDLYRKIISSCSRIDSAKKVAETLKHAIGMGLPATAALSHRLSPVHFQDDGSDDG